MKSRSSSFALVAALAAFAALSACSKSEAPSPAPAAAPAVPPAAAPVASAPAPVASAPAPAASSAASAPSAVPASAPAPSSDVDNPTPLPAKEIKGTGTQQKVSYYYSFNAPAGALKITATARNAPSGATDALRFGLYDLKANRICFDSHGNTTSDKTVELKCNVEKAQPVILRLDLSEETIDYTLAIVGNIELPAAGASAAGATPPAGAGSTDIDEPTKLKTHRVRGEGPKKPVAYYYAFNAGPGELTLTIDGRNTSAATTEALIGGLYTLRSEKICETQLGNTTLEKRAIVACRLDKRQPVILRLDLGAETVDFRARFDGPYDFEEFTPPRQVTIALDAAVLFDSGSFTLKPEAKKTLDEAAARLKKFPDVPATVSGHTDSVGNDASNRKLSENRAQAVRDYFVKEAGIPAARLSTQGLGKSQPVADNASDAGRARNRRVEVQFTPR